MAKYINLKTGRNIIDIGKPTKEPNNKLNENKHKNEISEESNLISGSFGVYPIDFKDSDSLNDATEENISELMEYLVTTTPSNWYKLRIRMIDVEEIDLMEERFVCFMCKSILYMPILLEECGHRFCDQCWSSYIKTRDPVQCPMDNTVVNQDRAVADNLFIMELENLQVYCPQNVNLSSTKEGCLWKGILNDLMGHYKSCPWRPVTCPRECGHSIEFQKIKDHINQKCRLIWRRCGFCKMQVIVTELAEHENSGCPEVPIPCHNNCGIVGSLPRKLMIDHQNNNCPLEPRICPFRMFGCTSIGNEVEMQSHLKKKAIPHLAILAEGLSKNSVTLGESVKTLLDEKVKYSILEKKIATFEKSWGSQLIWKVEKFFNKYTDAKTGSTNTYFSPTFFSSPYGYKLALGLCPYGDGVAKGTHLSVFVCICRGEYDNLLEWPFPWRITFSLLDQAPKLQDRRDVVYSFIPNTVKDNLPFLGRPQGDRNPFFGARKLISFTTMMEHGTYTLNETIFFKVNIQEK